MTDVLEAIDTALGPLSMDGDDGRRVYLAYLIAVEGRSNRPNDSRRESIAELCGRFRIANPFPNRNEPR